jgi:hypothetical protein
MITASRGDRWEPGVELAALLRRKARQLTIAIGVANLLGGVLVAVFLSWVVPLPVPRAQDHTVGVILVVPYLLVALVSGQLLGRRTAAPVFSWLSEGRRPDAHERE